MGLKRDLLHCMDPVRWASDEFGFEPDEWQEQVLVDETRRVAMNISRQGGKSTVTALKALHRATFRPKSLVLLLSPSQRQSNELYGKITDYMDELDHPPTLRVDNKTSCMLANRSRIVSLPSTEGTIRGYSAPDLIIADESARIPDEVFTAIKPALAVSNGQFVMLSTPRGCVGYFHDVMTAESSHWSRYVVTAYEIPRISPEFLAIECAEMAEWEYQTEYECKFVELEEGVPVFRKEDWEACLDPSVAPLNLDSILTSKQGGTA